MGLYSESTVGRFSGRSFVTAQMRQDNAVDFLGNSNALGYDGRNVQM